MWLGQLDCWDGLEGAAAPSKPPLSPCLVMLTLIVRGTCELIVSMRDVVLILSQDLSDAR
jgi:hypothetical protein